jgi:hypothetical protein
VRNYENLGTTRLSSPIYLDIFACLETSVINLAKIIIFFKLMNISADLNLTMTFGQGPNGQYPHNMFPLFNVAFLLDKAQNRSNLRYKDFSNCKENENDLTTLWVITVAFVLYFAFKTKIS